MTTWKFIAYSQPYGIAGTSYQLQMGRVNDTWTMRILKDGTVLKQQMFSNPDVKGTPKHMGDTDYFPETNTLIGWVKISILLPNINEYSIARTIGILIKEAKETYEKSKLDKNSAGKGERDSVILQHVNENDIHRPISPGAVVDVHESKDPTILHQYIKSLEIKIEKLQKENENLESIIERLRNE